jgi:endonuclease III
VLILRFVSASNFNASSPRLDRGLFLLFIVRVPRESFEIKKTRATKIIAALHKVYPHAHCELNFSNPLELLVATILSAQCTDKRVNIVTQDLFKKYRTAADFAEAKLPELEQAIKTAGFYRNKARNIQSAARSIVTQHGGQVPGTMEELVELGGVGRKTANVVLGNAFDIQLGIAVDTHVARLSYRFGFTVDTDPVKIEETLMKLVPQEQWTFVSHVIIWHGRRRCFARKPDCRNCEILNLCPRVGVEKKV